MANNIQWFNGKVVYQIYPRSFYDSNDDGVGDLKGIIEKLDYLKGNNNSLNVDIIWISPVFKSPMADFGYDVSDYEDIDPIFGNLEDFKQLLKESHDRGLKVILDFVPNHTSEEHPWFLESKSSLDNPKRDWYVWKDPIDNHEPTNWLAVFGGTAWELDPSTNQYYLHSFTVEQPDLNWDNPDVREAMKDAMRFWLDMGIDGFRMDAVPWISKDKDFKDDPINENENPNDMYTHVDHTNSRNGQHLTQYLSELAEVIKEYQDRFMVIEAYPEHSMDLEYYIKLYEEIDHTVCSPFNFEGLGLPWSAKVYKDFIDSFEALLKNDYVPMYNFGNHDRPRIVSRIGEANARTAAMLLLTLPGTPTLYNGEELGLADVEVPEDQIQDPWAINNPGKGLGRDPSRNPLIWTDEEFAGFSKVKPWLPVSDNYKDINIMAQLKDNKSFLNLYKKLLRLRDERDSIKLGSYSPMAIHNDIFSFKRIFNSEETLIVLNFSNNSISLEDPLAGEIILSTYMDNASSNSELRPNEGLIIRL